MTEPIGELDVCPVSPPRCHLEIFQAFDSLEPGDPFVLGNDHDPKGPETRVRAAAAVDHGGGDARGRTVV